MSGAKINRRDAEARRNGAWRNVKLGDVCIEDRRMIEARSERANQTRYLSLEHIESGTGRILREAGESVSDEGSSTTFAFDERHVLYGKLRPYLNKVALPDFSGRCTTELIPLLPTDELARDYLAFILRRDETVAIAMSGKTGSRMPRADMASLRKMEIQLPPLEEQRRIAARLREQLAAVSQARTALEAQLAAFDSLLLALIRDSLDSRELRTMLIADCLREVNKGVGEQWRNFPVLGATRAGLAPAKEGVGKNPGRYKPVRVGTVFYNPMRILLGSIAIIDEDDAPGITSPDYVAMIPVERVLHPVWFYHWFRSPAGEEFIKSLTRGAVRERLLFNRLAKGAIPVPDWPTQVACAAKFREIRVAKRQIAARLAEVEKLSAALLRAAFRNT